MLKFMLAVEQINEIKSKTAVTEDRIPLILGALGDPGRFRIFKLLMEYHDICVTDVARIFGITVSAASQQLRVLEMLGLVKKIRMGQMVCYELRKENAVVQHLVEFVRASY